MKPIEPSPEEQARLTNDWEAICAKLNVQSYRFPLRFGERFDCAFCIFSHQEGWMVLDVMRGEHLSSNFYSSDDELFYASARNMTFALAGWEKEKKNKVGGRKALVHLLHYADKTFDLRLQGALDRRQMREIQVPMMRKISPEWGDRLSNEYRKGEYY
jgi:hypothetical protein